MSGKLKLQAEHMGYVPNDRLNLYRCQQCFALIELELTREHFLYHEDLDNALTEIFEFKDNIVEDIVCDNDIDFLEKISVPGWFWQPNDDKE